MKTLAKASRLQRMGIEPSKNGNGHKPAEGKVELISKPDFRIVTLNIKGISDYLQDSIKPSMVAAFDEKYTKGSDEQRKTKPKHKARDYKEEFEHAIHRMKDGTPGIPSSAFSQSMTAACALVNFTKTLARLSFNVLSDGHDRFSGQPLIAIKAKPEFDKSIGWNSGMTRSPQVRIRARYRNWSCKVRVNWDNGQLSVSDIVNLMVRAGQQVGIGNGRPGSPKSGGLGLGMFEVELQ